MRNEAPKSTLPQAGRRRRDWMPMGFALCLWLCILPLVFLLVAPWLGVRAALVTALVLLVVVGVACWALCTAGRVQGHSARMPES